ncbi:hypothetical protein NX059_012443 [Plenodomus lindquistii]|nr:hypothetical protein NX059_012443 [Plenodomus lindquistii]
MPRYDDLTDLATLWPEAIGLVYLAAMACNYCLWPRKPFYYLVIFGLLLVYTIQSLFLLTHSIPPPHKLKAWSALVTVSIVVYLMQGTAVIIISTILLFLRLYGRSLWWNVAAWVVFLGCVTIHVFTEITWLDFRTWNDETNLAVFVLMWYQTILAMAHIQQLNQDLTQAFHLLSYNRVLVEEWENGYRRRGDLF